MLFRNMRQNLYETDNSEGTPPPTPATSQDRKEDKGSDETVTMTVKELGRINAKEAKDARAKAEKDFLERLGAKSEDELKTLLTSFRESEEAKKSEEQRLQERIAALEKERDTEKEARSQVEKQRRLDKRDGELKLLLSKAQDADKVLILMKATESEKLESLVDENGNFDKTAAEKLVTEYSKNNAYLFKDTRMGSALSNKDGKAPEPNKDAKEAAQKRTFKNMRNNI